MACRTKPSWRPRRAWDNDPIAQRLRRKADQAWELAGLARADGDSQDSIKHTEEAREYQQQLSDYIKGY